MRRYKYRTLNSGDIKRILKQECGANKTKDILDSYAGKEIIKALYEERDVVIREYYKKENLKWYNILMRFTFPLIVVFVLSVLSVHAVRWCFTGMPLGIEHGSLLSNFFEKWSELGKFKL